MGVGVAGGIGLAASGLSAITGAVGAISSSSASSANARYQAQVATNNATIANQNATLAGQQADAKAQADYRAGAIKLGAQRAALGANGGTLDTGSALDVQANTARSTQLGVSNDMYQGQLQGYGYTTQAGNFTAQAGLDTTAASNDSTAGLMSAGGSLVSGASQFASKWNSLLPNTPGGGVTVPATTANPEFDT